MPGTKGLRRYYTNPWISTGSRKCCDRDEKIIPLIKKSKSDAQRASGRIETIKKILYWKNIISDFIVYVSFKIRNPLRLLNSIIARVSSDTRIEFTDIPVLNDLLVSIQRLIRGNYYSLLDWAGSIMSSFILDGLLKGDDVSIQRINYPSLAEFDKYKVIIDEIVAIFKNPRILFNLLISERDADGRWLDIYDKYLENLSLDQMRKMYESIHHPITIMQRATWYKRTSFALFGDLPVLELLSYIIYLASENQAGGSKKENDK